MIDARTPLENLAWYLGVVRAAKLPIRLFGDGAATSGQRPASQPPQFLDGRVGRVAQAFVDLERNSSEPWGALRQLLSAAGVEALALAQALCDEVMLSQDQAGSAALCESVVGRLVRSWLPATVAAQVPDVWYQRLLIETLRGGWKKAGLYETLAESSAQSCFEIASQAGCAALRYRGKLGQQVVFVAQQEATAKLLQDAFERATLSQKTVVDERGDPRAEIGDLLGYPACCSERYLSQLLATPGLTNAWLEMERRIECAGEVRCIMNPALDLWPLKAVPCQLNCAEATRVATGIDALASGLFPAEMTQRLRQASSRPWLMSLVVDGAGIELMLDGDPEIGGPYTPGLIASCLEDDADPVIRAAKVGDYLDIGPSWTRILRGGRVVADLTGRAYVWWAQRPVQGPFLAALLQSRRALGQNRISVQAEASEPDWGGRFRSHLAAATQLGQGLGVGITALRYRPELGQFEFRVNDSKSGTELVLWGGPASKHRPFVQAGGWAFYHPADVQAGGPAARILATRFAEAMNRTGSRDAGLPHG